MTTWIELPKDKVHRSYHVPLELATREENSFFATAHHPQDTDGPWPFLAFLRSKHQLGVVTFQIFTIEAEALESEAFNPLAESCGYLTLTKRQLLDLARLLFSNAEKLMPLPTKREAMFRPIETLRLRDFHLRSPSVPDCRECFYYQTYDPSDRLAGETTATLLILSSGQSDRSPDKLYIKIAQFPFKALNEPSFNPLDHSLAKIHLDRGGMQELAGLLELKQKELVDQG